MYRRIIVVASVFVLVIVTVASFFSIRITMQEEQGALCEQLMQAARYAARSAKKEEDLDHIAALMGARVTRISLAGEVLYDSGGQSGYYLDQPDVIRAISAGAGEEISFTGRLAQMQVAVSVRQGDSILRLTKSQTVFRNGDWGLFAALMCILLVVAIYISFVMASSKSPLKRRISSSSNPVLRSSAAM